MLRVIILADLAEPVGPGAWNERAALAFEIADALRESSVDVGEFSIDLVARRGSWRGIPLISIDPDELQPADEPIGTFARQEAAYMQLVLAGMLSHYDVVHCLAPIVTPLQLLGSLGRPILHTAADPNHATTVLPMQLLGKEQLVQVSVGHRATTASPRVHVVPAPIDMTRFQPLATPASSYVVWLGSDPDAGRAAREVAADLELPLKQAGDDDPAALLQHAAVLLHFDTTSAACGSVWTLRALSCGTPVAAWHECGVDELLAEPSLGAVAPRGDVRGLAAKVRALQATKAARAARRHAVLARHTRRSVVGRYRTLYQSIVEKRARAEMGG
jgi:hypothetical protein